MIACRTVIGYGAPEKAGTAATHGAPLGDEEVAGAREKLGWSHPPFEVPEKILKAWRAAGERGGAAHEDWRARYEKEDAGTRAEFDRRVAGELPAAFAEAIATFKQTAAQDAPKQATRQSSGAVLDALGPVMPELIGGSADLTGSNNTKAKSQAVIEPGAFEGGYIHYGVREHGMAAIMNGMALHRGVIPYGGTFLVFSDYCRPAIRLSALMGQRVIYVMTHDSIGLGEDGPTHQPVEHLPALRAIPNLTVYRPADAAETAEAWALALSDTSGPSVLVLTRQGLPYVSGAYTDENRVAKGGYVLAEADGARKVTLIATGSEVEIALAAREALQKDGAPAAVVSMPSWELFDAQPQRYRDAVLGPGTVRVAVEAAIGLGWEKYIGSGGGFVGMTGFGASAPADKLFEHFGITAKAVVEAAKARL
jgi:transketolase